MIPEYTMYKFVYCHYNYIRFSDLTLTTNTIGQSVSRYILWQLIWQPRVGQLIGQHDDRVSANSVADTLPRGAQIIQDPI